jgi:hypothetical protein
MPSDRRTETALIAYLNRNQIGDAGMKQQPLWLLGGSSANEMTIQEVKDMPIHNIHPPTELGVIRHAIGYYEDNEQRYEDG